MYSFVLLQNETDNGWKSNRLWVHYALGKLVALLTVAAAAMILVDAETEVHHRTDAGETNNQIVDKQVHGGSYVDTDYSGYKGNSYDNNHHGYENNNGYSGDSGYGNSGYDNTNGYDVAGSSHYRPFSSPHYGPIAITFNRELPKNVAEEISEWVQQQLLFSYTTQSH